MRELKSQVAMKKIERVPAGAVATSNMRKLGELKVQNEELHSKVTRLHSRIDNVKQLRAEVARLDCDVEKVTVSQSDMANMRDEAVERAYHLSAQIAASIRLEDAYKSEQAAVKDVLVRTRVESANLCWSANDLVAKVREAFTDFDCALRVAVQSSNCSLEDVSDKVETEVE